MKMVSQYKAFTIYLEAINIIGKISTLNLNFKRSEIELICELLELVFNKIMTISEFAELALKHNNQEEIKHIHGNLSNISSMLKDTIYQYDSIETAIENMLHSNLLKLFLTQFQ